jgi:hypothetical protein
MDRAGNSKNFVDTAVTLPQYLVLTGGPTLQVGLHRKGKRPTEHLAREKVHGGNTSWQPRKRLRRRKRNTNRSARRNFAKTQGIFKEASTEEHLQRGFFVLADGW